MIALRYDNVSQSVTVTSLDFFQVHMVDVIVTLETLLQRHVNVSQSVTFGMVSVGIEPTPSGL